MVIAKAASVPWVGAIHSSESLATSLKSGVTAIVFVPL
jgi:hypothetical protein